MNGILIYLIVINVVAFLMYGIDKQKARAGAWRISEKALLTVALLGGSLGALFGMHIFHHKTRKPLFAIGIPCIILLQIFLYRYLIR